MVFHIQANIQAKRYCYSTVFEKCRFVLCYIMEMFLIDKKNLTSKKGKDRQNCEVTKEKLLNC